MHELTTVTLYNVLVTIHNAANSKTDLANEVLMTSLTYNRSLSFKQCWLNIGSLCTTLAQHETNSRSKHGVPLAGYAHFLPITDARSR